MDSVINYVFPSIAVSSDEATITGVNEAVRCATAYCVAARCLRLGLPSLLLICS